jgi:hypothetical protein
MADTIQIVRWAIRQGCRLRADDAVVEPSAALSAVGAAQTYAGYLGATSDGFGVFGDVCVTGYTFAKGPKDRKGNSYRYPSDGFVISETFKDLGGVDGLGAMCRQCPANGTHDRPAGCAGTLYQRPFSDETQEQLERIIDRLGLSAEFAEVFPQTTPIWYGLWARSPVSRPAMRLLRLIIAAIYEEDAAAPEEMSRTHLPELAAFVRAVRVAEERGLELRVSMAPPGHTDLGWYTVFPHCPFCKAEARLERWRRSYPTQLYVCEVCGTAYPPSEMASSTRDRYDRRELSEILGTRFRAFAKIYLQSFGATPAEADRIIDAQEAWERERKASIERDRLEARRQERYVRSVLYAGLHPSYDDDDEANDVEKPAEPGKGDAGDDDNNKQTGFALFDAAEFAELLRRCHERGVKVTLMFHRSTSEDLDRWTFRAILKPLDVLAKWQSEGCGEKFGAGMQVPKAILDAFDERLS